ncbi:hypothetical protein [Salinisphaera orenii]|uniref:hypothetical protein n=1 Tax=Salinisphaera orenii TaxID=856731 RepID=UPI000DBE06EC
MSSGAVSEPAPDLGSVSIPPASREALSIGWFVPALIHALDMLIEHTKAGVGRTSSGLSA